MIVFDSDGHFASQACARISPNSRPPTGQKRLPKRAKPLSGASWPCSEATPWKERIHCACTLLEVPSQTGTVWTKHGRWFLMGTISSLRIAPIPLGKVQCMHSGSVFQGRLNRSKEVRTRINVRSTDLQTSAYWIGDEVLCRCFGPVALFRRVRGRRV